MIALTGGTGFVGSQVCARGVDLRVLSRRPLEGLEVVRGTLEDPGCLDALVAGADAVIHAASKAVDTDGRGYEETNVAGTRRLVEAACRAGVRRFIHLSSAGVYGHGAHEGTTEAMAPRPDTALSRSRRAAEEIVEAHHARGDFDAVILRPRFVYGEGDQHFLPRLRKAAGAPLLPCSGRARLTVVEVGDLAGLMLRLATEDLPRLTEPALNVGDGAPCELGALLRRLAGQRPPRFVPVPFAPTHALLSMVERVLRRDPETASGLTTLRLGFLAQDNLFDVSKLRGLFPDWSPAPLLARLAQATP